MRAPGILGWDREEEQLTDWREQLHKTTSSTASGSVSSSGSSQHSSEGGGGGGSRTTNRRKSREEHHRPSRSRDKNEESSRSIERLECDNINVTNDEDDAKFMTSLCKSFSTSSASTWMRDDFRYTTSFFFFY